MHFALALWQMSSIMIQAPEFISIFRSLDPRVAKVQLGKIILSEQIAVCQTDKKKMRKREKETQRKLSELMNQSLSPWQQRKNKNRQRTPATALAVKNQKRCDE